MDAVWVECPRVGRVKKMRCMIREATHTKRKSGQVTIRIPSVSQSSTFSKETIDDDNR